jgi:hypothetical protein
MAVKSGDFRTRGHRGHAGTFRGHVPGTDRDTAPLRAECPLSRSLTAARERAKACVACGEHPPFSSLRRCLGCIRAVTASARQSRAAAEARVAARRSVIQPGERVP